MKMLFAFLFGVLSFTTCAFAESTSDGPKAVPDIVEYDFGTVSQGSIVENVFNIANKGNADLKFQNIVPTCGCTAAFLSSDVVVPGDTGALKIRFDTAGFSGSQSKRIRVTTNDPENSIIDLKVKGRVEPSLRIEPSTVSFGQVLRGVPYTQHFSIMKIGEDDLSIGQVLSYSRFLKIKPAKQGYEVTLLADVPQGEFRDRIIINFKRDNGTNQTINVPVYANIKGLISVSPATLSFGIIEGKDPFVRAAQLTNQGSAPVKIADISTTDDRVKITVKTIKDGYNYVIKASIDPTTVSSDIRAVVTIKTEGANNEAVSLGIFGALPPKKL